nr:hypothetical protein [Mesorhizobium sp.]
MSSEKGLLCRHQLGKNALPTCFHELCVGVTRKAGNRIDETEIGLASIGSYHPETDGDAAVNGVFPCHEMVDSTAGFRRAGGDGLIISLEESAEIVMIVCSIDNDIAWPPISHRSEMIFGRTFVGPFATVGQYDRMTSWHLTSV